MINTKILTDFLGKKMNSLKVQKKFYQKTLSLELALISLLALDDETEWSDKIAKIVFEREDFRSDPQNIIAFIDVFRDYLNEDGYTVLGQLMKLPETPVVLEKADKYWLLEILITGYNTDLNDFLRESKRLRHFIQSEITLQEIKEKHFEWNYFILARIAEREDVKNYILHLPIAMAYKFCLGRNKRTGQAFTSLLLSHPDAKEYFLKIHIKKAITLLNQFHNDGELIIDILLEREDLQNYVKNLPKKKVEKIKNFRSVRKIVNN